MNKFVIVAAAALALLLLKLFYTAQEIAEERGKPRVQWLHTVFWVLNILVFLICAGVLALVLWVSLSMFAEGNWGGGAKMLSVALLLGPGVWFLFLWPLLQKRKSARSQKK